MSKDKYLKRKNQNHPKEQPVYLERKHLKEAKHQERKYPKKQPKHQPSDIQSSLSNILYFSLLVLISILLIMFKQWICSWDNTKQYLRQNPVDWSTTGATGNRVINQLECGSCYAIATAQSIESAMFIKSGGEKYIELSPQYIVDWDPDPDNNGCQGGIHGFMFAATSGIPTEDAYPYDGYDLKSHTRSVHTENTNLYGNYDSKALEWIKTQKLEMAEKAIKQKMFRIQRFVHVRSNEQDVLGALKKMPCFVSMAFRGNTLSDYKNGVISKELFEDDEMKAYAAGKDLKRHAMLAVGMGIDQETGIPFMKFKNSWGKDYGEDGYVRIEILTGQEYGLMNMYESVYYPVV